MKTKRLVLPGLILAAAVLAMVVYAVCSGITMKPTIAEKDFPFSITYELNGKTETIESVYSVQYIGNDGYVDIKTRIYKGKLENVPEEDGAEYVLSDTADGRIVLDTQFYADYLMGDPLYEHFTDTPFAPELRFYDAEGTSYTDAETLAAHSVKLIDWEYPVPVENTFVFSHISIMTGAVVLPMLLIALAALLATVVFVKKDDDVSRQSIDVISIAFNFILIFLAVPFLTIFGVLSDIIGVSAALSHQMGYLVPALTVLGIAASVSLRRKGFAKSGFAVQFIGPAVMGLILLSDLPNAIF